jgi:hypothetical protein
MTGTTNAPKDLLAWIDSLTGLQRERVLIWLATNRPSVFREAKRANPNP